MVRESLQQGSCALKDRSYGIGGSAREDRSSTAQSTKRPPVRFKIFVAENGTRQVELAEPEEKGGAGRAALAELVGPHHSSWEVYRIRPKSRLAEIRTL